MNFGFGDGSTQSFSKGSLSNRISREEYLGYIHEAIEFLNGNDHKVEKILLNKMQNASEKENFEKAIEFIKKTGFENLYYFKDRKPVSYKI